MSNKPHVNIQFCRNGAIIPSYASEEAAGADLHAYLDNPILIEPLTRVLIPTGLKLELEPGYEAQVRPRSGLALRSGITVLNSPGTIDSDYRGEISIILINLGDKTVKVENGDRIAQLVVCPVSRAEFIIQDEISSSLRGEGGFGSTGL